MSTFAAIILFVLGAAAVFLLISLAVWWLVPLAFPALSFGFGNAMALTALGLLFAGLSTSTN